MWGSPRAGGGGAVSPLVGTSCLYEGHFYFDLNMGTRIYFAMHLAWLKLGNLLIS
jgi:hypothetical protein